MDLEYIKRLIDSRKNELFFYSPYSFLRNISQDHIFNVTVKNNIIYNIENNNLEVWNIKVRNNNYVFLLEYLNWDTNYFNVPTYKLFSILYAKLSKKHLSEAVQVFQKKFFNTTKRYCFCNIPSEDIYLLQALTGSGFKLIETRMTYFLNLNTLNNERFKVRSAKLEDIDNLKKVAKEMSNPFDRFHADPIISNDKADKFLSTYIEESLKGFADEIIVPNEPGVPPDAFVTAKFLKDEWISLGTKISKMVLSAVSSKTCKGWYIKLISEMAYLLKDEGADFAFMHPASTNRAVIHSYEKLGCKLGQVSHIFSFAN